jgi:hypothetical protein
MAWPGFAQKQKSGKPGDETASVEYSLNIWGESK